MKLIVTGHEPVHDAGGKDWPRIVHGVIDTHRVEVGPTYRVLTEAEYEELQRKPQADPALIERARERSKMMRFWARPEPRAPTVMMHKDGLRRAAEVIDDLLSAVEAGDARTPLPPEVLAELERVGERCYGNTVIGRSYGERGRAIRKALPHLRADEERLTREEWAKRSREEIDVARVQDAINDLRGGRTGDAEAEEVDQLLGIVCFAEAAAPCAHESAIYEHGRHEFCDTRMQVHRVEPGAPCPLCGEDLPPSAPCPHEDAEWDDTHWVWPQGGDPKWHVCAESHCPDCGEKLPPAPAPAPCAHEDAEWVVSAKGDGYWRLRDASYLLRAAGPGDPCGICGEPLRPAPRPDPADMSAEELRAEIDATDDAFFATKPMTGFARTIKAVLILGDNIIHEHTGFEEFALRAAVRALRKHQEEDRDE